MATKSIAWNTGSGNITLTYQGQGDGTIIVESDENTIGSSRSQTITVETVGGSVTQNLIISQVACPFPVGDVKTYSYTGSYQEVELPAGQYKLQCWGAQGGSNAAASSYSITAKAGGKGGYSEGIITLSTKTTVRVYVGGQGTSSAGGFNGGGSTTGSSSYNSGGTNGVSRMGGGGGATDIRLSDGALLSRMIVAGGGAGGAMCYKAVTSTGTVKTYKNSDVTLINVAQYGQTWVEATTGWRSGYINVSLYKGSQAIFSHYQRWVVFMDHLPTANEAIDMSAVIGSTDNTTLTIPSTCKYVIFASYEYALSSGEITTSNFSVKVQGTTTSTSTDYQVGGVGGGTQGGGYSSTYAGKQASAGTGGSFGQGANQTTTGYRYCSGAGGGGWYGGGGGQKSNSSMTYSKYSGGGSGFVNTAASAGNRPSGYTGLELDSGTTYAGNTSFPSTSGGTETGHSGNGYAKITRLS